MLICTFNSQNEYSETDIIRMVEFLIDNFYDLFYVGFGGHVYQQIVGISMGTIKWAYYIDLRLEFDEDGQGRIQAFRKGGGSITSYHFRSIPIYIPPPPE